MGVNSENIPCESVIELTDRTDAAALGARSTSWQLPTVPCNLMVVVLPLIPWRITGVHLDTLRMMDLSVSKCLDAPLSTTVFVPVGELAIMQFSPSSSSFGSVGGNCDVVSRVSRRDHPVSESMRSIDSKCLSRLSIASPML